MFAPRLPPRHARSSFVLIDTRDTTLGRAVAARASGRDGESGVHLLHDGKVAFAARAILARTAERSLDVQYYIWHDDLSGSLLLDELHAAADRKVRVRLLLDDNGIGGLDDRLAALDEHPSIEVRLFNPFVIRTPRALNWLLDFSRLNRRMHAKSLTADNQATIVGGRNVGDEYFGAKRDGLFADLDALCLGEVVGEVSRAFDRHWNSAAATPVAAILKPVSPNRRRRLEDTARRTAEGKRAGDYRAAIEALPLFDDLSDAEVAFDWAPVRLLSDDPARALGRDAPGDDLADQLWPILSSARGELCLVSGYFVPTSAGADELVALARAGVRVRVLTNSYAANDVGVVHAGYAPLRHRLLAAGVELFEMPAPSDKPKTLSKFVRPGTGRGRQMPGSTLHAKTFAVDAERLFVGSFNMDRRSTNLNTELGIAVDSPRLAGELSRSFTEDIARNTYRLCLTDDGAVAWVDERDDKPMVERTEPGTNWASRALIRLLSRLPIRWLL